MRGKSALRFAIAGAFVLAMAPGVACAEDNSTSAADPHAAHRSMLATPAVKVDYGEYRIPDVSLLDTDGNPVALRSLLAPDRPVAVNFIFTTCTTICPVMTATMLQLQRHLDGDAVRPNFVSISIDPDYDSAQVMKTYAERYGADWTFLTGTAQDVESTLRAFDAYRGNKVNHFALTLMRAANDDRWTRVEGLTSAHELARIWQENAL